MRSLMKSVKRNAPSARLMEVVGVLIERDEHKHVPELTRSKIVYVVDMTHSSQRLPIRCVKIEEA